MSKPEHEYWAKIHLKGSYDILTVSVSANSKREAMRLLHEEYPTMEVMYGKPKRAKKGEGENVLDTNLWTIISFYLGGWWWTIGWVVAIAAVALVMKMCSGGE